MTAAKARGRVSLVGAGPGDPGLATLRAIERLREADVVFYDELASKELLTWVPDAASIHNVGKRGHDEPRFSQEEINERIVAAAGEGLRVVRLKGGDPFVFGRGGEEASACARAGIAFDVVPGVSSALAAPAFAGIPVTDRRHAASFAVVTGHKDPTAVSEGIRWGAIAQAVDTVVILMGMRTLPDLVARMLEEGIDPKVPAAVVSQGSNASQRVVEAPLEKLVEAAAARRLRAPAVIVIGDVVRLRHELDWFVPGRLAGVRVLVTRATDQAATFTARLGEEGALVTSLPLVEMGPPQDSSPLDAALVDLERFDAVVFASENAVRFTVQRALSKGWMESLASARPEIACVGEATAEAARRAGLEVACVGTGGGVELVAEIEKRGTCAGRRFLSPRSEQGGDEAVDALRARGAQVEVVVAYRNLRPQVDAPSLCSRVTGGELDVLTFASPSAARHFASLLDAEARAALEGLVVAALGETTAAALREEGIEPDVIPERPTIQALVEALVDHVGERR